MRELH